jgi:hypothetical protein
MLVALGKRRFTGKRPYVGAARFKLRSTNDKSTQPFSPEQKEVGVEVAELYLSFASAVAPRLATD